MTDELDFSPKRQSLRGIAADNVRKKAAKVKERALKKSTSSVFKEGDVVLVPLNNVNRTKVDGASICGVICQIKNDMCTVAIKEGVLWKKLCISLAWRCPRSVKQPCIDGVRQSLPRVEGYA